MSDYGRDEGNKYKLESKLDTLSNSATAPDSLEHLASLSKKQRHELSEYLVHRLKLGSNARYQRMVRYLEIDRFISTWKTYDTVDSKRKDKEAKTGEQSALKDNIPLLAAYLADLTSYYAETLSPVGNPIVSAAGDSKLADVVKQVTRDISARGYYNNVTAICRALLKYNIGGIHVEWDTGIDLPGPISNLRAYGSRATAVDPYNVLWDPAITMPDEVADSAEWCAIVTRVNRLTLMRQSSRGSWAFIDEILSEKDNQSTGEQFKLWYDSASSVPTEDGQNKTAATTGALTEVPWAQFGLSIPSDGNNNLGVESYEHTIMYAWVCPKQLGLLSEGELEAMTEVDPDSYLELWRFDLIDNCHVVSAAPYVARDPATKISAVSIPVYLSYLIQDELKGKQRSHMELASPFQRIVTSLMSIGVEGFRMANHGTRIYDSTKISENALSGDPNINIPLKGGGDATKAFSVNNGLGLGAQTLQQIPGVLHFMNTLFPVQALPSQVAGVDRAVNSQVAAVMHGAQQSLRMSLRQADSGIFARARIEFVRNLQRYSKMTVPTDVSEEQIAKELGSGVESLEAERISGLLWQLITAIIQNRDAIQQFDVPLMLRYLGNVMRVHIDLGNFVKQPQQPTQAPGQQTADPNAELPAADTAPPGSTMPMN